MKKNILVLFSLLIFNIRSFSHVVFSTPEESVEYALNNVKKYSLAQQQALLELKAAKLSINEFLPTFDITLSNDDSIAFQNSDSRSKSISFNLNQKLFDGGKRTISYNMAKAEKYFGLKTAEQNIDSFKSSVLNQYYNCIMQTKYLSIKTDLEKITKNQLDIIEKETELGLSLESDYLEYLISYKKIQDEKRQSERELRTQYRVFKVLIGMEQSSQLTLSNVDYEKIDYETYLEPYILNLWEIIKQNNPTIQKSKISLYFQQQQFKYQQRFYIPELTLQYGVSFNGAAFPLNDPKYNATIVINFSNFPFFPSSLSNTYGFSKNKLTSTSNSGSISFSGTPAYFHLRKNSLLTMMQQNLSMNDELNSMYEKFFELVSTYDDSLDSIKRMEESIELQEKRIEISKKQVEKGDMKRIDFLNQLVDLAEQKIQLEQSKINILSTIHNIEIIIGIPFGGVKKCIKMW